MHPSTNYEQTFINYDVHMGIWLETQACSYMVGPMAKTVRDNTADCLYDALLFNQNKREILFPGRESGRRGTGDHLQARDLPEN